jgi:1-acyl-sn-glycerol-3-phosphate acyltransferase
MYSLITLFKYFIFIIDLFVVTLSFLLVSLLPVSLTKNISPKLFKIWSLRFFRIFLIQEHIHEKNHQPIPNQFILISNHPSGIELLWLPSRFNIIPLAKAEISKWFIIGRITKSIGTIFVQRADRESRHAASTALIEAAKHGKSIMIFPEGGCYGKRLQPFFMGAFHLSKETGLPILPVYLHYEEENSYYWGDYGLIRFMLRALFIPNNRNAHLYIFDPIHPENFKDETAMHQHVFAFYQQLENKYAL